MARSAEPAVDPMFTIPSQTSVAVVCAIAIASVACGGSPTGPATSSQSSLHAEVTDPPGDALRDARVPNSPDLVRGTMDVVAGNITLTVRVAPSTFNQLTTRFTVLLNTDQNLSTGTGTLGVEYFVQMGGILGNRADVVKSDSDVVVGSVPVAFVATGIDATLPLALIGNDDGRLDFKVFASAGPVWPEILDRMPDEGLPAGRVQ
jgi:hypothetical protein